MSLFQFLFPVARPRGTCPCRRRDPRRLLLEALEDRTVPSTLSVTSLANAGPGSLRQAVQTANASIGVADLIKFAPGLHGTINLTSEIAVTDDLTIDGPNANRLTVSGGNTTRVFHVSGGATDLAIDG